jgi:pyridoxamine 5'-phosphate oxidase
MTELNDFVFSNRSDFTRGILDETTIPENPQPLFERWLKDAIEQQSQEPYAFTLITNGLDGFPSGRVVYLRTLEPDGSFMFFTNYNSEKGRELEKNDRVSVNFFWSSLERQVRIKGRVSKIDKIASDLYFDSRPEESKLGAWASAQSQVLQSRQELLDNVENVREKFKGQSIPRPEFWGGYVIVPESYEFWQGRSSRLHDRFKYSLINGIWRAERLSP